MLIIYMWMSFYKKNDDDTILTEQEYKFGIPGFESLIGGNVPDGAWISSFGPPGSLKTLIGIHFIYEGLKEGGVCVLVASEEKEQNIIKQASAFNIDFASYISQKKLKILSHISDPSFYISDTAMTNKVISSVREMNSTFTHRRLVIDSLTAYWSDKPAISRKVAISIKSRLGSLFNCAYCTIQAASTVPHGFGFGGDFLSDGLIEVGKYIENNEWRWYAMTHKMRCRAHSLKIHLMKVFPKIGVVIGNPIEFKGKGLSVGELVSK